MASKIMEILVKKEEVFEKCEKVQVLVSTIQTT
jgi:hypothetical protein